jgi:thioredoxin 1
VSEHVFVLTDENWESEVLKSPEPVLVDFWAPWCAPCRMIAPFVEAVAGDFAGRARVGKMNVDENPVVPQRYRISSIPTLLLFRGGQLVDQRIGALPQAEIAAIVERHLAPAGA